MTISAKLKTNAAYGTGKSAYEQQDYENTVQWTGEFIKLAGDTKDRRLYQAYYIMGKANLALNNSEQAYKNFYHALDAELGPEEYVNIVTTLVNAYIEQENFIEAMAVVNNAQSRQLPRRENIEVILLKSQLLRKMGFVDNALSLVGEIQDYIEEPQLKAGALYESAKCYVEQGRLELARRNLAEILETAKKDEFFDKCCLELAEINLEMGQSDRAISVCERLLEANPEEAIRQKALEVMAQAYKQKKDYNQAVLALVDGLNENEVIESQQ